MSQAAGLKPVGASYMWVCIRGIFTFQAGCESCCCVFDWYHISVSQLPPWSLGPGCHAKTEGARRRSPPKSWDTEFQSGLFGSPEPYLDPELGVSSSLSAGQYRSRSLSERYPLLSSVAATVTHWGEVLGR